MLAGIAVRISTRALIYTGYLATCLAAACSSAPTPGANAPDSPVNITDLQNVSVDAPTFEVGDQVNFVSEAGVTERTVIVATGHGRTYRVVEADGDIWIQHYDENSNRFLSEREDGSKKIEVVPSTIKYEFPLFVGKSWSGSFFPDRFGIRWRSKQDSRAVQHRRRLRSSLYRRIRGAGRSLRNVQDLLRS